MSGFTPYIFFCIIYISEINPIHNLLKFLMYAITVRYFINALSRAISLTIVLKAFNRFLYFVKYHFTKVFLSRSILRFNNVFWFVRIQNLIIENPNFGFGFGIHCHLFYLLSILCYFLIFLLLLLIC